MKKILDGIIDDEKYKKSPIKILWVLKEGNVAEKDKDMQRDIREEFRSDCHKKNALSIPTFRKMIYATYGILHSEKEWSDVPYANEEAYEVIKQIAYININKYPAGPNSYNNNIKKAYNDNKEELLNQIDEFKPNIIIFGNTFIYFENEDLEKIGWSITDIGKEYADNSTSYTALYPISSSKLIINAYHPSYIKLSDKIYWSEIREAYNIWNNKLK